MSLYNSKIQYVKNFLLNRSEIKKLFVMHTLNFLPYFFLSNVKPGGFCVATLTLVAKPGSSALY